MWYSHLAYRNIKGGKTCYTYLIRAGSGAKPQPSSATNAACISNSNVVFGIMLTAKTTVEEGDMADFLLGT